MNKNEIARGLEALAGEGVPANADLWPQLQAQVGAKKKRRQANPRRRAGALLAATVVVLVLALGALTPTGTNAATGALGLFGLQPISAVAGGPTCTGPGGTVDPVYTPVEPGAFTIVGAPAGAVSAVDAGSVPVPEGAVTAQAMQLSCPDGYELTLDARPTEGNAVLHFFGVTTIAGTAAAPSCVGEGGRVDVIHTDVEPGTFTITTMVGEPPLVPVAGTVQLTEAGVAATQISCPAGYELTIDNK